MPYMHCFFFFFFNDTATTEIYTLSLHDALPILRTNPVITIDGPAGAGKSTAARLLAERQTVRSEEHTSELQSRENLVCRLLLEKKKNTISDALSHLQNRHRRTRTRSGFHLGFAR